MEQHHHQQAPLQVYHDSRNNKNVVQDSPLYYSSSNNLHFKNVSQTSSHLLLMLDRGGESRDNNHLKIVSSTAIKS
jgi:hypothetical protein